MIHQGTKMIETENLILRPFTEKDYEPVFRNLESDREAAKYLTWQAVDTVEETKEVLDMWIAGYKDRNFYQWAIVPKELNEPVGTISAVHVLEKTEEIEVGYCLGSSFWRRGYASEALRALIPFFFEEVGIKRMSARHDVNNPNSGKVMMSCGLRYEGTLRGADWNNQGICDARVYALLEFEYRIRKWLKEHQDLKYRDFNAGLIPNVPKKKFIGVRTPELRAYAKILKKEGLADRFLDSLPHAYFEENQIHAFLISELKDYEEALCRLEEFLPYIDNWATCDQLRPGAFKKNQDRLLPSVRKWIHSDLTYTKRYAVGVLHYYYLDEEFRPEHLKWVAEMESGEYYVDMMNAWYFATALTKQYEMTLPLIEAKSLDPWVHNKFIQKARESRLIPDDRKKYLQSLKF